VVLHVRRTVGIRAVGHTGTLDPFATGLLVVLLGRGTRLARFIEQQPKTYRATMRLGQATDTDDDTGTVVAEWQGAVPEEAIIRATLEGFRGRQLQEPPAYSAKRVDGERSHRLARRGEAVALRPVEVTVHALDVLEVDGRDVTFRVTVSAGTYIRALARDAGQRLGVGAHLTALRREAIGPLRVEDAVTLEDVTAGIGLRSLAEVMGHVPSVVVDDEALRDLEHGRAIRGDAGLAGTTVLRHGDDLVAVAEADDGWLRPKVVLVGR
jgi:tRNA pseudouridine55 synthase